MRTPIRAAVVAIASAAAVSAPAAAHAVPSPARPFATVTALLGTYDFGRAAVIGRAGKQAGAWKSYTVRSGFAGDDLTVTYKPRIIPLRSEKQIYTAAFNESRDAEAECRKVGDDGVARKVWVSFRCRTGFAPSYTLLVR
ncbi:hypothetical protein QLQ12_09850 [Actinoplanes sp. NEAU-A12]|uniref:Uncharacterized protein n=1 Tax=Actinoplanes sandaracinus TaxID=3045177 RepID=A0ABT6WGQ9_9ACTN|nr:hypothetical protein [Actinoplanes sandaracinus]MDI6098902.1 hypothetical protein [Actinoplanes sandaracinus]